jgi:hypothetical protein
MNYSCGKMIGFMALTCHDRASSGELAGVKDSCRDSDDRTCAGIGQRAHSCQIGKASLNSEELEMQGTQCADGKSRPDVTVVTGAPGRSGTDLVIEALDEFAPASTNRVSGTCLCATNADYVYGTAARN